MDELTITRPDDWHLHLRDGEHMRAVVADSCAAVCARDRHAQPQAAGDDDRARAGVPAAHPGRAAERERRSNR